MANQKHYIYLIPGAGLGNQLYFLPIPIILNLKVRMLHCF